MQPLSHITEADLARLRDKIKKQLGARRFAHTLAVEEEAREIEKLYLRLLLVTDYICGMTDSYAKRLYQELNAIV